MGSIRVITNLLTSWDILDGVFFCQSQISVQDHMGSSSVEDLGWNSSHPPRCGGPVGWTCSPNLSQGWSTVDGQNPANQLRLVVYPTIYKVLYIPGGAGFRPSTVCQLVFCQELVLSLVTAMSFLFPKAIRRKCILSLLSHHGLPRLRVLSCPDSPWEPCNWLQRIRTDDHGWLCGGSFFHSMNPFKQRTCQYFASMIFLFQTLGGEQSQVSMWSHSTGLAHKNPPWN